MNYSSVPVDYHEEPSHLRTLSLDNRGPKPAFVYEGDGTGLKAKAEAKAETKKAPSSRQPAQFCWVRHKGDK